MGQEHSSAVTSAFTSAMEESELSHISGFQLSSVLPESPGMIAGLIPFFDIITAIDGVDLLSCGTDDERLTFFKSCISSHINVPLSFEVYNLKVRQKRVVLCTPSRSWGGTSVLGCSILWTKAADALMKCIHVVGIAEGSAAAASGMLHEESDYIVGYRQAGQSTTSMMEKDEGFLHSILADAVLKKSNEDPYMDFFLLVYNSATNVIQEVPLQVTSEKIGIAIASGILHIIPSTNVNPSSGGVGETDQLPVFIPPSRSAVQSPLPQQMAQFELSPDRDAVLEAFPAAPPPPTIPAAAPPPLVSPPVSDAPTETLPAPALNPPVDSSLAFPPPPSALPPLPPPAPEQVPFETSSFHFPFPDPASPPPPLPALPEAAPSAVRRQNIMHFDPDQPLDSLEPSTQMIPSFSPHVIPTFPEAVPAPLADHYCEMLEPHRESPGGGVMNIPTAPAPITQENTVSLAQFALPLQLPRSDVNPLEITPVEKPLSESIPAPFVSTTAPGHHTDVPISDQECGVTPQHDFLIPVVANTSTNENASVLPLMDAQQEKINLSATLDTEPAAGAASSFIFRELVTPSQTLDRASGVKQEEEQPDMRKALDPVGKISVGAIIPPPPPPLPFPLFSEIIAAKGWPNE